MTQNVPLEEIPVNAFRLRIETAFGELIPQTIPAASLQELFDKAAELPVTDWFPPEWDG